MPEATVIFLTILFSDIFEYFEDPEQVAELCKRGAQLSESYENEDIIPAMNDKEALRESISVFLMHYLENSPKNVKNSRFSKALNAAIKACDSNTSSFLGL